VRARALLAATLGLLACSDEESVVPATSAQSTASSGGSGGEGAAGGQGGATGGGGQGGGCENTLPNEMPPLLLSETGLYGDIGQKALAPYVMEFEPRFQLWSDGAEKTRWVYLPECDPVIDNTDEDNWSFPVGTRMWKEFRVGGELMETRLVHRWGDGPDDFVFAAYVWREDDSDADRTDGGMEDVKGTEHDVPNVDGCRRCHGPWVANGGLPSRYLGFGAIQLSHGGAGVTMATLSEMGALVVPSPGGYAVPGTPVEQAALGYLHANCGNCHNDSDEGLAVPYFDARVKAGQATPADTGAYQTIVNQPIEMFVDPICSYRIAGLSIAESCVHVRMSARGSDGMPNSAQMPPIASDVADTMVGIPAIEAWIATLPAPM
jgi:hypothetical protein